MLVVLPSKQIAERWEVFKQTLRESVPVTRDMLPSWLKDCLFHALTGHLQCWLAFSERPGEDRFYAAFVTKAVVDELTGQQALLVYAFKVFEAVSREVRSRDFDNFLRIAKEMGCQRVTAFCGNEIVFNSLRKVFPKVQKTIFASLEL